MSWPAWVALGLTLWVAVDVALVAVVVRATRRRRRPADGARRHEPDDRPGGAAVAR